MSFITNLRNRRYDKNQCIQDVLKVIDDSRNYVKVRFTPTYINVEYWVKTPQKMVQEMNFFFDDYEKGYKPKKIKQSTCVEMRNYVFTHMKLQNYHQAYNDDTWHAHEFDDRVPCIYPKTK